MSYDANKFRALGVGETVNPGHFQYEQHSGLALAPHAMFGHILIGDETYIYLEKLVEYSPGNIPIAKDVFPSGAARSAAEGRGRFDLIPYEAMLSLARRYELGAKHFGDRNWEKGQPLSRLLSSMRRHSMQINYDFTEDHVGAVLWNAAAFTAMVERIRAGILPKTLDDIGYFAQETAHAATGTNNT